MLRDVHGRLGEFDVLDDFQLVGRRQLEPPNVFGIEQAGPGSGPSPAKWFIREDIERREPDNNPLPSLEEVCGVDEDALSLLEMPADWPSADSTDVPF